jgi:hypothetical protein
MTIRHDWSRDEVAALFERPFNELLFAAQQLHRTHHDPAPAPRTAATARRVRTTTPPSNASG